MWNEKGAALIMGMISLLMLWTLGMTLVLVTARNASARELAAAYKRNFYLADGGVSLAKDALLESVEDAFEHSLDTLDSYMDEELESFLMLELEKELSGAGSEYIELESDENGHVTGRLCRENVDNHLSRIFKRSYRDYFLKEHRLEVVRRIESINAEDVAINVKNDYIKFDLVDALVMEVSSTKSTGEIKCVIDCKLGMIIPEASFGHIRYDVHIKAVEVSPLASKEQGDAYESVDVEVAKSTDERKEADLESLIRMSNWVRRR